MLTDILGTPVEWQVLKDKPGRRRTARASGPRGTAIVKWYASERAPVVATRVTALCDGPSAPAIPAVLGCDPATHTLVLSDVAGAPFSSRLDAAADVGRALGVWHRWWAGRAPVSLQPHTAERELEVLDDRLARAEPGPGRAAGAIRDRLADISWSPATVVHRDLYEEQIMIGPVVGLIDLDDVAIGPPELDLGNLLAHLDLLGRRGAVHVGPAVNELLDAYRTTGPVLDEGLLDALHQLSKARLACIHNDAGLLTET